MACFSRFRCLVFLLIAAISAAAQSAPPRKVDFGINGHPLNRGSYSNVPPEQQIALLKTLHLTTYRVNVNPSHTDKFARLSQLITMAERENIRILPVLVLPPKQYSDETTAYSEARTAAYAIVARFETHIAAWELGNEYDLYCLKSGANGASPDDYDPAKYAVVRGLLRGMLAGVHAASPPSRTIVETTQHTPTALDSGFLEKLIHDGITFDVTGYHYYSRNGRVPSASDGKNSLQFLYQAFHKPIWITEFDESCISPSLGPSSDPKEQGKALRAALNEIAADAERYDVIGADIYELLDQPELLNNPDVKPCEAQFGILDARGDFTDAARAVEDFLRAY